MRALFPRLLAGVLALALVLTAETMAMARAANPAVGETFLCTGHGVVQIHVDADGAPTTPPHVCPDCLLFFAAVQDKAPLQPVTFTQTPLRWAALDVSAAGPGPQAYAWARAPPKTR